MTEMYFHYPVGLQAISMYAAITTVNTVSSLSLNTNPKSIFSPLLTKSDDFLKFSIISIVVYYDVPNRKSRQDKSKPADIDLIMNFTNTFATARFWEVRVTQIPFSQRAPAGCLQYFFGNDGIIQVNSSDSYVCVFCRFVMLTRKKYPAFLFCVRFFVFF